MSTADDPTVKPPSMSPPSHPASPPPGCAIASGVPVICVDEQPPTLKLRRTRDTSMVLDRSWLAEPVFAPRWLTDTLPVQMSPLYR
jgi:hypothetical protein